VADLEAHYLQLPTVIQSAYSAWRDRVALEQPDHYNRLINAMPLHPIPRRRQ
jgi:hypothetical protein